MTYAFRLSLTAGLCAVGLTGTVAAQSCGPLEVAYKAAQAESGRTDSVLQAAVADRDTKRDAFRLARAEVEKRNCDWEGRNNPECAALQADYKAKLQALNAAEQARKLAWDNYVEADLQESGAQMELDKCRERVRKAIEAAKNAVDLAKTGATPPPPPPVTGEQAEKGLMGIVDNMPESAPSSRPPSVIVIPASGGGGSSGRQPGGRQPGSDMPTGGGESGHTHDPLTGKDVPNPCDQKSVSASPSSSMPYKTMAPTAAKPNANTTNQQPAAASATPDKAKTPNSASPGTNPSATSLKSQVQPASMSPNKGTAPNGVAAGVNPTSLKSQGQPAAAAPNNGNAQSAGGLNNKPNGMQSNIAAANSAASQSGNGAKAAPIQPGPRGSGGPSGLSNGPRSNGTGAGPQLASTGHQSTGSQAGTNTKPPGTASPYPTSSGGVNPSANSNNTRRPIPAMQTRPSNRVNTGAGNPQQSKTATGNQQRSRTASLPSHKATQRTNTQRSAMQTSRKHQVRQRHASVRHASQTRHRTARPVQRHYASRSTSRRRH